MVYVFFNLTSYTYNKFPCLKKIIRFSRKKTVEQKKKITYDRFKSNNNCHIQLALYNIYLLYIKALQLPVGDLKFTTIIYMYVIKARLAPRTKNACCYYKKKKKKKKKKNTTYTPPPSLIGSAYYKYYPATAAVCCLYSKASDDDDDDDDDDDGVLLVAAA